MPFGIEESKYYKDNNEFGRKTFSLAVTISICIISAIVLWQVMAYLAYSSDCSNYNPLFISYCNKLGYTYDSFKFVKEDKKVPAGTMGAVYKVKNFKSRIEVYSECLVTLFGKKDCSTGFRPDSHIIR